MDMELFEKEYQKWLDKNGIFLQTFIERNVRYWMTYTQMSGDMNHTKLDIDKDYK